MQSRTLRPLLAVFLLLLIHPQLAQADPETYVVEQGDALSTVARRFDVTVEDLRRWNHLDGDLIRVGQELAVSADGERSSRRERRRRRSSDDGDYQSYTIAPGDTLSEIARSHHVTVTDIVGWNRGLDPDRIREGQEIRLRGTSGGGGGGRERRRIRYEVESGDFVAGIARSHGVSVEDIVRWNEGLDPDRVRIGQELTIYVSGAEEHSASVGRASRGRLEHGEQLPTNRAYEIRDADRAWGTNDTIRYIRDGFDAVLRRYPDAPRVSIHDLSDEDGGSMRGHRSHQSGRDADISYYQTVCRSNLCPFRRVRAANLDVERQWALMRHWIRNDQVQYIFMDYRLQEVLYAYVRDERGATEEQLDEWFQYPHGRRAARGIIRHEANHADHMHVRFTCSDSDDECSNR